MLNELIENTAKYSDAGDKSVDIRVWLLEDEMVFKISNYVTAALAESFRNLAREILAGNPEELYIRRLEKNTERAAVIPGWATSPLSTTTGSA